MPYLVSYSLLLSPLTGICQRTNYHSIITMSSSKENLEGILSRSMKLKVFLVTLAHVFTILGPLLRHSVEIALHSHLINVFDRISLNLMNTLLIMELVPFLKMCLLF